MSKVKVLVPGEITLSILQLATFLLCLPLVDFGFKEGFFHTICFLFPIQVNLFEFYELVHAM